MQEAPFTFHTIRYIHTVCLFFSWTNPATGFSEEVVVVAGGAALQTELLFMRSFNVNGTGWRSGPNLPVNVFGTKMVSFQVKDADDVTLGL